MARKPVSRGRRRRQLIALLALLLAWNFSLRAARADDLDSRTTMAIARFDAGRKAFEGGRFEEALLAFQESYSLSASPNSRLFMARSFRALGKVASAYTSYRRSAREAQDRLTATGEKRYGATRDTATSEAAEIEPQVPRLTIVVPGETPEGFVLKKDGVEVPKEGWGLAVETDSGPVRIDTSGPRLVAWSKTIELAPGAQARVDVEVRRLPTAFLALAMKMRPAGASITFDGTPVDLPDVSRRREVDVGEHVVVVDAPGYAPFTWRQTLADGDSKTVEVTLRTRAFETPRWAFYTAAGASVVAEGVATGLALAATSSHSSQLAETAYQRSTATQTSIQTMATAANVLFIGGGVVGLGAVGLFFTTKWKSDGLPVAAPISFTPTVGPSLAGLAAHGEF